jgi:xylulokinase
MSLLGIDLGTTGCKAAAFSEDGECLAHAYREYPTRSPQPGWAELESRRVWDCVRDVISEVAAGTGADPVTALSTSSYGEALTPVSADREILGNAILCVDSRGEEYTSRLEDEIGLEDFYRINPNVPGPQYSLPKLMWLKENDPALFDGADFVLPGGDWVGFMLGCEARTSSSLANRTLLFDLDRNDWSDRLLEWGGIPRGKLGPVVPGGEVMGEVSRAAAEELGLPAGVAIVSGGHDQCCNALGCGCIGPGSVVCGIGTFECLTPVFSRIADRLDMLRLGLSIEHHVLPDLYVSFVFNQSGSLVKWFRDTFASADVPPDGGDVYEMLNRELPEGPTGLLVLPHFEEPVSPRYISGTAGVIVGLKTTTTRGEILKSIMECATLYFVDSIDALRELGVDTARFVASGGGAKSDAWLQIKADIFGVPFVRPRISEGSLLGAAMLAGIATGVFPDAAGAVERFVAPERTFEPDEARHEAYTAKLDLYRGVYPANRDILSALTSVESQRFS